MGKAQRRSRCIGETQAEDERPGTREYSRWGGQTHGSDARTAYRNPAASPAHVFGSEGAIGGHRPGTLAEGEGGREIDALNS